MPIGLMLTIPFAGPTVSRFGGRTTIGWSFPAFLAAMCLPACLIHIGMLFLALFACGVTIAMVELGMNIVADDIERSKSLAIMSRCHGFWSLGMMTGSLIGSGLAALSLVPQLSILLVALVIAPLGFLVPRSLPEASPSPPAERETGGGGLFVPGLVLLSICIIGLASNLAEGASADWSAIYLTDVFATTGGAAGLGYTAYALMMAAGRFSGDWLRVNIGPMRLVRYGYAAAALGVILLATSRHYLASIMGFALIEVGGSVGVPLAVSAVASVRGRSPAANVAMVTLVWLIAFLAGPPVIGYLAEHYGLRAALGTTMLPAFFTGLLLAGTLSGALPKVVR